MPGIEDAFLQVSKQLIHLYETIPNSGMGSLLSPQQPPDLFSPDAALRLPNKGEQSSHQSKDSGCQC